MLMLAEDVQLPGTYSTDKATVRTVLARLRRGQLDDVLSAQVWDDLDEVLGEYAAPSPESLSALLARLDAALTEVLRILPSRLSGRRVHPVLSFAGRVIEQPLPDDYLEALGVVRRVAVALEHASDLWLRSCEEDVDDAD